MRRISLVLAAIRDVDDGGGDNDDAIWLDFSFPLWKAKDKPDALESRVRELERRLATLDALMHTEQHEPRCAIDRPEQVGCWPYFWS